ncbi:MAG: hypothetical protein JSU90_11490 [Nitrospiraceae bacterium]|nr:MAG: hypothetical protein JSU90_11490 [Nitrospiraceae bacterium]
MAITIAAYICTAVFLWRVLWHILLLCLTTEKNRLPRPADQPTGPMTLLRAAEDVLFLTRLYRVNKLLWAGEWVFHGAFFLVVVRHLRYFFYPVPEWILSLQTAGLYAGAVLPLSLLYILAVKFGIEKKSYFSSSNFMLLLLLILVSATGILMTTLLRTDLVEIKHFTLSALALSPVPAPESTTFIIHFVLSLVFLVFLPTHIFAAPYTLFQARKRDDTLHGMMHKGIRFHSGEGGEEE